jgi:hypothetical protein
MQQERNAIILRARDRLRQAFGAKEFERFDAFLQAHVKPAINRVNLTDAQR